VSEIATQTVAALMKQLRKSKNLKVRVACFQTLAALSKSIQFHLDEYFETLLPELESALNEE
jgi:hypothetical protein